MNIDVPLFSQFIALRRLDMKKFSFSCFSVSPVLFFAFSSIDLAYASKPVVLVNAPIQSLQGFVMQNATNTAYAENVLREQSRTQLEGNTIIRYQQWYKGIPIVGAQITTSQEGQTKVNGYLIEQLDLDTRPSLSKEEALQLAKQQYPSALQAITGEQVVLQLRDSKQQKLQLVYLVSFKSKKTADGNPVWPFVVLDAHTGELLLEWDNLRNLMDNGPGGNEKIREYWYGKDGLPALDMSSSGSLCIMENSYVRLVNLKSAWDWGNKLLSPYQYVCNHNTEDFANGAYSPPNDAYYFGYQVYSMYREWYGVNALQTNDGRAIKLIMRVHFGQAYENAFWDGISMSFGDSNTNYPMVSLDIAGHEVSHGFTQQHSGLEYHDESGALDESFSDMAGQASRAYLLEKSPQMYNKAYSGATKVTWGVGETVMRGPAGNAIRYMDKPSVDGSSADCLDKKIAAANGSVCAISYPELVARVNSIPNPVERQSYLVHKASGIFNKAFYLLASRIGIRQAQAVMIRANVKYWRPKTGFMEGACAVMYAGNDLHVDYKLIKQVFGQVGVDMSHCAY